MNNNKRQWWAFPWNYRESFSICIALILIGSFLDFLNFKTISFAFPNNIVLLVFLLLLISSLCVFFRRSSIVKWLSSIQASIVGILFFVGFSLVIALIPNGIQNQFIEGGITRSWMYHFVSLYMLLVLGMVTFLKILFFKKRNLFFVLNHLGLWLVLFFASTSSYNLQRLNMYVNEEQTVWFASDENNAVHELDFAIKLKNFDIEEYTPKIALLNNSTGKLVDAYIKPIDTNKICILKDFNIKVKKIYSESVKYAGVYRHSGMPGAAFSALISLNNEEKWISCGSYKFPSELYKVSDEYSIVMLSPEPKRFFSEVTIYKKNGEIYDNVLEVNKPLNINGWQVYQKSYNKDLGRWSRLSVIEAIKDDNLFMVYLGCVFMILGSFSLIFKAKKNG